MAKEGQGWHGQSKRHADAAKGRKTTGQSSKKSSGSGWYGESQEHSQAAKGESPKEGGLMDKL